MTAPQLHLPRTVPAVAAGEHEQVTRDVETLTGHPATPLRRVVQAAREDSAEG